MVAKLLTGRVQAVSVDAAALALGLLVTVVALAVAGRRLHWLSRLIRSGQPTTGRSAEPGPVLQTEVTEVVGQRRLLAWTVPGLAHAFVFWGFLRPRADDRRGVRRPGDAVLLDPGAARLGLGPFRRGPVRRRRTDRDRRLRRAAPAAGPSPAGARVALLRLAPRGRVARALHDLQRRVDAAALPRRPDRARRLPVPDEVGVRLQLGRRHP